MTTWTFDTDHPLDLDVHVGGGTLRVAASDTDVTLVTVVPHDVHRDADVKAAQETVVALEGDRLRVHGPRRRGVRSWVGTGPSIDVTVDVPRGASLTFSGWADVSATGGLGAVAVDCAMGDVVVEDVTSGRLRTAMGDVRVAAASGELELRTSAGNLALGIATGPVRLRTAAGDVRLGSCDATADLRTSAGDVRVGESRGELVARTSAGDVAVDRAVEGRLQLDTAVGQISVGVPLGTAAWLETSGSRGTVTSDLPPTEGPQPGDRTVEVHARTAYGDIRIRRATTVTTQEDA